MLVIAIILFLFAAVFGLVILMAILKDQPTPKPFVFIHGPLAALALILVIIYLFTQETSPLLMTSVALFIIAALGGLTLFTIDMQNKSIPKLIAMLHPVLTLIALGCLVAYVW